MYLNQITIIITFAKEQLGRLIYKSGHGLNHEILFIK